MSVSVNIKWNGVREAVKESLGERRQEEIVSKC